MDEKLKASRREALRLGSLAVAAATIAAPASARSAVAPSPSPAARPTADELERAKTLWGGEFGGGRGAR